MFNTSLFPVIWALHILGSLACFVGIIFLLTWAIKTLSNATLKKWGMWLAIVGLILCGITMIIAPRSAVRMKVMHNNGTMMQMIDGKNMSDDMMMNHTMMKHDTMSMSMDDMTAMLEGKTGDAFDQAFLEEMIVHHQGAIDMAKMVLTSAKHDELRTMANAIISTQQQEIDQMNAWLKAWGYVE